MEVYSGGVLAVLVVVLVLLFGALVIGGLVLCVWLAGVFTIRASVAMTNAAMGYRRAVRHHTQPHS